MLNACFDHQGLRLLNLKFHFIALTPFRETRTDKHYKHQIPNDFTAGGGCFSSPTRLTGVMHVNKVSRSRKHQVLWLEIDPKTFLISTQNHSTPQIMHIITTS